MTQRDFKLKAKHDQRSVQRSIWKWCIRPSIVVMLLCMPILAWWKMRHV